MTESRSSSASEAPASSARRARRRRSFSARRMIMVVLGWMSACWVVIGALMSPVLPGGWLTALVAALLSAAPLLAMTRWFRGAGTPSAWARLLVIRPFLYTMFFLPLLAIAGLLGALGGLAFSASGPAGRGAIAVLAVLLLGLILSGYAGTRRLVVRQLDVMLPQLEPRLEGLRIVQLSDLHVGPHTSRRHLRRVAAAVAAAQPDLVAITGDQVDDYPSDVLHFSAAFGSLTAPLGVFAIPGNHDIYAGWSAVRAGLEHMGIRVLVNEAVPLEHNGVRFWVAGTGDPAGRYMPRGGGDQAAPDVPRTLAGIAPGEFALVLAHNPLLWSELARSGVALTLSGHTHYGQVAIPRLSWSLASLFLEHAMGVYQQGQSLLYINPGTNFWGVPFRIGAPPEVTVLTLRRAEPGGAAILPAAPAGRQGADRPADRGAG